MGGSFKKGAGSLDFGDTADSDDEEESSPNSDPEGASTTEKESSDTDETTENQSASYPYFVRRTSVGDERPNRMEVHVRDSVADQESEYLTALANELDTDEVAKTDAREFALKLAYENPTEVARLMREEGYAELS